MFYQLVEQLSSFFREPFMNAASSMEGIPVLFALMLGIVGAAAPCQFSGNASAITLYGSKSLQTRISWSNTFFYTLGKITAFTALGSIVWIIGQEFQRELTPYFPWMRRILGPLLILIGLYMLGLFSMQWTIRLWKKHKKQNPEDRKSGNWGAFMLGFSFSLAFCPTMFILFFILLMPATFTTSYGIVLPGVFAIGTSIPFLAVIFLIWYFGAGGLILKKGRKLGRVVQQFAGGIMIFIGVVDILTFW
ncbi:sulfite exporter TauE/SafE family protein [Alkalicoccus saliphilus]|uniref:Cytochrome C biosynthesis protein n=1 Tax=Alkalicoccus saliphilus TaxID=200989 RepID=A0A2T4U3I1_9BACI|nr:sulfite exporter TauE/SafE family protein [Alkalicoccus saliphilus]PTL37958.1 cytochrome C biosynthesis protein [Alkalicoccus saliphilus]